MYTNNYYQLFKVPYGANSPSSVTLADGSTVTVDQASLSPSWNTQSAYYSSTIPFLMPSTWGLYRTAGRVPRVSYLFPVVGTGDTPATVNDYCLESDVTHILTPSTSSRVTQYIEDNENVGITFQMLLQNNTLNDITIKEAGLYWPLFTSGGTGNTYPVLVERTVLETPVTVAPNTTLTFNTNLKLVGVKI